MSSGTFGRNFMALTFEGKKANSQTNGEEKPKLVDYADEEEKQKEKAPVASKKGVPFWAAPSAVDGRMVPPFPSLNESKTSTPIH